MCDGTRVTKKNRRGDHLKDCPGRGRPKGSPNKTTKAIKEAALGALNAGDGAEAFFMQRKEQSPDAFMGFLKSVLPHEVTLGNPDGSALNVNITFKKP